MTAAANKPFCCINPTKKAVKSTVSGIGEAKTNGLLPAGRYTFGAGGRMILQ